MSDSACSLVRSYVGYQKFMKLVGSRFNHLQLTSMKKQEKYLDSYESEVMASTLLQKQMLCHLNEELNKLEIYINKINDDPQSFDRNCECDHELVLGQLQRFDGTQVEPPHCILEEYRPESASKISLITSDESSSGIESNEGEISYIRQGNSKNNEVMTSDDSLAFESLQFSYEAIEKNHSKDKISRKKDVTAYETPDASKLDQFSNISDIFADTTIITDDESLEKRTWSTFFKENMQHRPKNIKNSTRLSSIDPVESLSVISISTDSGEFESLDSGNLSGDSEIEVSSKSNLENGSVSFVAQCDSPLSLFRPVGDVEVSDFMIPVDWIVAEMEKEKSQNYQCPLCQKMFRRFCVLKSHITTHEVIPKIHHKKRNSPRRGSAKSHAINRDSSYNNKSKSFCEICETNYYTRSRLRSHMKTHLQDGSFVIPRSR